jgi:hypothetical protein
MGEYNEKMIAAKEKLLERFRSKERRSGDRQRDRLPPVSTSPKGFPYSIWACGPSSMNRAGAFGLMAKSNANSI